MDIKRLRLTASVISAITGFDITIGDDFIVKISLDGRNIYTPASPTSAREAYLFLEGMHTLIIAQRFYQEQNLT